MLTSAVFGSVPVIVMKCPTKELKEESEFRLGVRRMKCTMAGKMGRQKHQAPDHAVSAVSKKKDECQYSTGFCHVMSPH